MSADALYIAEDGAIQAFQSTAQYVEGVNLPNPYPGDTWEHDAMTGLNLPHITTETHCWVRLDSHAGQIIRRLIAERDEARELVRMARTVAPALCSAAEWAVWDPIKKALRRWGIPR